MTAPIRRNTNTESHGAEFLVLGTLMTLGIPSYIAHSRTPDFDVVATNPSTGKFARVQVKSRWESDAVSFPIASLNTDFVVVVLLRRGTNACSSLVFKPEFYVLPSSQFVGVKRRGSMGTTAMSKIPGFANSRDDWRAIRQFLL